VIVSRSKWSLYHRCKRAPATLSMAARRVGRKGRHAMEDEHHDVIIEDGGSSVASLLGIILAIVVVLAIVWFFFLSYPPAS
jgi:hypothetical protein